MATKKKNLATDPAHPAEVEAPPIDFITQMELFLEKHWRLVVGLLVVLVLGVVVFFYLKYKRESTLTEAGHAYSGAKTMSDYEAVLENHGGTSSAGSALLRLAGMKMKESEYDAARTSLTQFIADYEDHPLYYSAVRALGTVAEKQGNYDEAIKHFQEVIDAGDKSSEGALAAILKAEVLMAQGELEQAREIYDTFGVNFGTSPFVEKAAERMEAVEAKIEREAAPEAPPEPEPEPEPTPELEKPGGTEPTTPTIPGTTPTGGPGETGTTTPPIEIPGLGTESETTPADGTEIPAEEPTTPADGTEVPAEGTTTPAEDGTEVPAEEPTTPAEDGTEVPAEETTTPAEDGTEVPAEETGG